jgi:hypothetical protein
MRKNYNQKLNREQKQVKLYKIKYSKIQNLINYISITNNIIQKYKINREDPQLKEKRINKVVTKSNH